LHIASYAVSVNDLNMNIFRKSTGYYFITKLLLIIFIIILKYLLAYYVEINKRKKLTQSYNSHSILLHLNTFTKC